MAENSATNRFLTYLPAIFSQQENADLGEFLQPFQGELGQIEQILATIDRYVNPVDGENTPAHPPESGEQAAVALKTPGQDLPWLASMVAMGLDDHWNEAKKRRLIAEALELHLRRGTIEGLTRYLSILDDQLSTTVNEEGVPGGMQLDVSSRIGRMALEDSPVAAPQVQDGVRTWTYDSIKRAPSVHFDYYVVDTFVDPCHPADLSLEDAWAAAGRRIRFYHRTDLVRRIRTIQPDPESKTCAGEPTQLGVVELDMADGQTFRHEPATVRRLHNVADTRFTITMQGVDLQVIGDARLIDLDPKPHHFTMDIDVPVDWQYLFDIDLLDVAPQLKQRWFNLNKQFEKAKDDGGPDKYGRKKVTFAAGECVDLSDTALTIQCADLDAIKLAIRQHLFEFDGTTLEQLTAEFKWESERDRWLEIRAAEGESLSYIAYRVGFNLQIYRRIGDETWCKITGMHRAAKSDAADAACNTQNGVMPANATGEPRSETTDPASTATRGSLNTIRDIVDEVKPAHTEFEMRVNPQPGRQSFRLDSRYLFNLYGGLAIAICKALDKEKFPKGLHSEFDSRAIDLAAEPCVEIVQTGRIWRATDKDTTYLLHCVERLQPNDPRPVAELQVYLDLDMASLIDELDAGCLSERAWRQFIHHGHLVSDTAAVVVERAGGRWSVNYRSATYAIRKEQQMLTAYLERRTLQGAPVDEMIIEVNAIIG